MLGWTVFKIASGTGGVSSVFRAHSLASRFFQAGLVSHSKTTAIATVISPSRHHQHLGTFSALTNSSSKNGTNAKEGKSLPHFVSSMIGRRPYMEDTYAVSIPPPAENVYSVFAVFDGHAGANCARYLASHLINEVRLQIACDPDNVEKALKNAFIKLDEEFCEAAHQLRMDDGSTANMAVVRRDKESGTPTDMWVANTGDSRAVVVRSTGSVHQLSTDHKAIDEKDRIERMGGYIKNVYGMHRVNGILAVSRAFGDASLKPFVTAEPEVHHRKISRHDHYLCLATDGLWDEVSNDEAGYVLQNGGAELGAKVLSDMAFKRGSFDNITVMCVSLQD